MDVRLHLLKAQRNKTFLSQHLVPILDKCADWASVVAFYTALHFMEAFLKKQHGIDFEHHEERHTFIRQNIPRAVFSAYYRLYDLGFASRYGSISDAPTSDEANSAIQFDLVEVEKFAMSVI
jgi:hypothetical protein